MCCLSVDEDIYLFVLNDCYVSVILGIYNIKVIYNK